MGSPLGPALANILITELEKQLLLKMTRLYATTDKMTQLTQ